MKIIGIHQSGLNSSAALVRDGQVSAALLEERLTRQKYHKHYPHKAVAECLRIAGIDISDVDIIAIAWNPMIHLASRYRGGFSDWVPYGGQRLYSAIHPIASQHFNANSDMTTIEIEGQEMRCVFVKHHLCHASTSFFLSPFEDSAYITCDGYGETQTLTWGIGEGNKIKEIGNQHFPQSVGLFYSTFTEYMGFRPDMDEWKVMGASGYGDPKAFADKIGMLIDFSSDGLLELDLTYFDYFNFERDGYFSQKLVDLLGFPPVKKGAELKHVHFDLAASVQQVTENILLKIVRHTYSQTGKKNLCLSGGTFLNSTFNGKILEKVPEYERVFIPFCPDDAGNSIGAALYVSVSSGDSIPDGFQSPFLGPEWLDDEIKKKLDVYKVNGVRVEDPCKEAALSISRGEIVGWFQGKMEFGPRALGNRSILADPRNPRIKQILNGGIKFRERFRPFAPAILSEKAGEYFYIPNSDQVPYMEKTYKFHAEKKLLVPGVVHVDDTGRVQIVSRNHCPQFYKLIDNFFKITGVPIVLNTSFNLNGEPIVCSPEDALRTFYTSGIDVLFLGNYMIPK